jgi:hypothetical protein
VVWKEYEDWYALAAEAGVEFPERGSWKVEDVMQRHGFSLRGETQKELEDKASEDGGDADDGEPDGRPS